MKITEAVDAVFKDPKLAAIAKFTYHDEVCGYLSGRTRCVSEEAKTLGDIAMERWEMSVAADTDDMLEALKDSAIYDTRRHPSVLPEDFDRFDHIARSVRDVYDSERHRAFTAGESIMIDTLSVKEGRGGFSYVLGWSRRLNRPVDVRVQDLETIDGRRMTDAELDR